MKYERLYPGQKFNLLEVVDLVETKEIPFINGYFRKKEYYLCKCKCGNMVVVGKENLKSGHTKSCGCYKTKRCSEAGKKNIKHGKTKSKIYQTWRGIRKRCYYKKEIEKFKNYGGRGITICPEWEKSFQAFYDWAMSHGYRDDLTIDRIDVNGNYCPENCRWATNVEQQNNRRNNKKIKFNGEEHTIAEWSKKTGIKAYVIRKRYKKGYDIETCLKKEKLEKCDILKRKYKRP